MELLDRPLEDLCAEARALRDEGHGRLVTYSPKVFIPLTKLCRDVCHYCTFAQPPRRGERAYLTIDEVLAVACAGAGAVALALHGTGVGLGAAMAIGVSFQAVETFVGITVGLAGVAALAKPASRTRRWSLAIVGTAGVVVLAALGAAASIDLI